MALTTMIIQHSTGAPATEYIDTMCNQLVALHIEKVRGPTGDAPETLSGLW